ncbi:hypothetical protein AB1Y20_015574 [Prymnesium parvum]|uniref:PhoH-like protein n=1 Tax=Prymnesium parvum TaxID=97485 RepID=A0AB34K172_PRYPA
MSSECECKYFLTAGGCKRGDRCAFAHTEPLPFDGAITCVLRSGYIADNNIFIPKDALLPRSTEAAVGQSVQGTRVWNSQGRNAWRATEARLQEPLGLRMRARVKECLGGAQLQCGSVGNALYQIPGAREEVNRCGGMTKWLALQPEFEVLHDASGSYVCVRTTKRKAARAEESIAPRVSPQTAPKAVPSLKRPASAMSPTSTRQPMSMVSEDEETRRKRAARFGVVPSRSSPSAPLVPQRRAVSPPRHTTAHMLDAWHTAPPGKLAAGLSLKDLRKKDFAPITDTHAKYVRCLRDREVKIVVCLGPPGTGKTTFAVHEGLQQLEEGVVTQIMLSRPEWEARPEDIPELEYLVRLNRPALEVMDMIGSPGLWRRLLKSGHLVLQRFSFLKGLTLSNTYVLVDEAQNISTQQLYLVASRLSDCNKLAITGDSNQQDMKAAHFSSQGLLKYASKLEPSPEAPTVHPDPAARSVRFNEADVVRGVAAQGAVRVLSAMLEEEALCERGGMPSASAQGRLGARALGALRTRAQQNDNQAATADVRGSCTSLSSQRQFEDLNEQGELDAAREEDVARSSAQQEQREAEATREEELARGRAEWSAQQESRAEWSVRQREDEPMWEQEQQSFPRQAEGTSAHRTLERLLRRRQSAAPPP